MLAIIELMSMKTGEPVHHHFVSTALECLLLLHRPKRLLIHVCFGASYLNLQVEVIYFGRKSSECDHHCFYCFVIIVFVDDLWEIAISGW